MKYTLTSIFSLLLITAFGQQTIKMTVSGQVFNSTVDSVSISQYFGGTNYRDLVKAPISKKGDFVLTGTLPSEDYYVFRVGTSHINVILKSGSDIKIYADGKNIRAFSNIVGSEETKKMNEFLIVQSQWNFKRDSAVAIINQNPEKQQEVNTAMTPEYYKFQNSLQTFINENPNSPALIVTLQSLDKENDFATYEKIIQQLNSSFGGSAAVKDATNEYNQIKAKKEAANLLAPGKPAPEFEELKLDRKNSMKLSDLKGQVVLLDFWASWCGPCRRENPNVVAMYDKYNKAGFTVMSVSLDKDLEPWKAAIEKDNLKWPNHVSDLKQWSSKVAQQYQVRGIPFTVLIDREGKIIQTNLRGEALEAELQRIFGF